MLPETDIKRIYNERRVEFEGDSIPKPEFNARIFIEKRIVGVRQVDTVFENPRYVQVFDFEDGGALVMGSEGRHDWSNLHCLLLDSRGNDKYAEGRTLFDAGWIKNYCS